MILKGNQRGGASNLAGHLLKREQNEHVTLHELRGFCADDLVQAMREIEAVSKGTRCRQYMFSLSLNPPESEKVTTQAFEDAINDVEKRLGLDGQPRAIVFHEKEGRRHAHCVWSRRDSETMTAINLPHYKLKLRDASRSLFLEMGWHIPDGLREQSLRDPLNFTRAQWQQAKRVQLDPREIKALFKDAWASSDTREALQHALREKGFWLARGDRRGFVAVDYRGEVYALAKWTGTKARDVATRLGDSQSLPTVDQVKKQIGDRMTDTISRYAKDVEAEARSRSASLEFRRSEMTGRHRQQRLELDQSQRNRWVAEHEARTARLPKGLGGIWHRITGRYGQIRQQNERETWTALLRDSTEKDDLVLRQLDERQPLQRDIKAHRVQRQQELLQLREDLTRYQDMQGLARTADNQSRSETRSVEKSKQRTRGVNRSRDREPKL